MDYIALFFAGAFLCNGVPHLVAGLQGRPFPTPFAKPPAKGNSSPLVNFLWGFVNILIGLVLWSVRPVMAVVTPDFVVLVMGALIMGIWLTLHFAKVQAGKPTR
ncbi:hypothetical protein FBZ89_12435 [Nitrospirillum amazonense]|uniref:Uncharacterized protein n=1 Tax=Nitrospirillum amazonense TaxID=28077 RepID=A0A560ESS0_9PROT|nr:hypothetical protein [Nitrospirillum amazonense]TWB12422.1 hypothetical protein FBZ89_12435 [Nitrospirillum amazonense]